MRSWTLTTGQLALVMLSSVVFGGQLVMLVWALATGRGTKAIGPAVVVASMALIVYSILRAARRAEA
jgi:hypothetical protein